MHSINVTAITVSYYSTHTGQKHLVFHTTIMGIPKLFRN